METETRPETTEAVEETQPSLSPEKQRALEWYQEWLRTPLTPEEIQVLDDLEEDLRRRRREFYGDE
jgi:hypothetical protein